MGLNLNKFESFIPHHSGREVGPIQVSWGKVDWDEVQECAKFGLFIVHNILCNCGRAGSWVQGHECHRM